MSGISISGISKNFGKVSALKKVDLEIHAGELFFLLGPSGCGKTTLLRTIAGFYEPDEGTVYFGDEDLTKVPPHKRNTGMMFQSYALWPHMTVEENVSFGLEQRKTGKKERQERVAKALESVRILEYRDRKPNELSGGQQQRVALARALVIRPRCLLLDEPLSNLDAKLRLEMRMEIRRVCKEFNLTTIYVTHDQKEALSVADRLAVLDHGEIQQVGTPEAVYKRPGSRFVADFIGETNFLPATVIRSGGGYVQVSTALGQLTGVPGNSDNEWTEGEEVTVSIRPECIHLETIPTEENGFSGKIGESVYYGEIAQYHFWVNDHLDVKVFELNPRFGSRTSHRDYHAWVSEDDVTVLKKD